MIINPVVVDIYHGNDVGPIVKGRHDEAKGFEQFARSGGLGVIHKASQGTGMRDSAYARRRKLALNVGLLWGAYHFNNGEDVAAQVDHFFRCAEPDDHTLMALDFEDNPKKSNMNASQARKFLQLADERLGRKIVIYGGNRIKELLPKKDAFFASHRLWLCQYGARPKLPAAWMEYWLWQYAADGVGPQPHKVAGFEVNSDLNTTERTPEQLAAEWA